MVFPGYSSRIAAFLLCFSCGLGIAFPASLPTNAWAASAAAAEDIRQLIERSRQLASVQPDTAEELAQEALVKARNQESGELLADALNNLAFLYYRRGRLEQARATLEEALATSQAADYRQGSASALNRLGNVLWFLEDRLEAKNCYERALEINTKLEDWKEISRTLTNLANAYRFWDDYPRAIELFLEARDGYEKVDYQEGVAWLDYSLGILHKKLGDYDNARKSIVSALEIYELLAKEDGSYNGVMLCYAQLGDICNLTGEPEQGLEYHLQALQLRRKSGNNSAIADGLSGIAESYFYLGDFRQSLEYFDQSQKIRDEIGIKDGTASNMIFIGKILQADGKPLQALEHFNRGLAAARELEDRDSESEILEITADLLAGQGRYREAWEALKQHHAAQNLVLNAKISKRIASLELQHEIEKRGIENQQLQRENRIKDLQLDRSQTRFLLLISLTFFVVLGGVVAFYLHRKQVQIKTLQGLIPICSHCKSVRTDSGYYQQLESFLSEHSDVQFSHGICPECYRKYYQEKPAENGEDKNEG